MEDLLEVDLERDGRTLNYSSCPLYYKPLHVGLYQNDGI